MKTDVQIAQEAQMKPIVEVASQLDISDDELELYGKYKAKISPDVLERLKDRPNGKLVLVTAINPTPAGEGKTTTNVGLSMALNKLGKKTITTLREPSLGPCFGIKGGAAGGGYSQVVPMDDINLHFTGDFHAITSAHNLLAAMLDNHIHQGNALDIVTKKIVWKRVMDMNDRSLRHIIVGLGKKGDGVMRESGFDITVASEIMAILCLATDIEDLKARLSRMVVAYNSKGGAVTAGDLQATGAMALLLKDAIKAEPGTDTGKHTGYYSRRTFCQYRSRLQLRYGNADSTEAGRLRGHRGRIRCGPGCGEILRYQVPVCRTEAGCCGNRGNGSCAEDERRRGKR